MDLLLLLALALAPGIAIILFVYVKDEYEQEPARLIRKSFLYGVLSVLITTAITTPLVIVFGDAFDVESLAEQQDAVGLFFLAFFGVALVEEFSKWFVIKRVIFHWKNFNEPLDGIVYSVMVSMGFATLENIFYVLGISSEAGLAEGYATGFLRMFTAVPSHATDAVIMGFFIGKAKFDHKNTGGLLFLGLVAATLSHGLYDYFLFVSWVDGLFAGAFVSLLVSAYLSVRAINLHKHASPFHPDRISSRPLQETLVQLTEPSPETTTESESEQR